MNSKSLMILLVAAGATVAIAAVALRSDGSHAESPAEAGHLFPALAGARGDAASTRAAIDLQNSIATIRVQRASGGYTLRRVGDAWTLQDRGDFPVQFDQVKRLVNAVAETTIVEAKTSDPARFAKLGVEDFDAPDSKSVLVTLADKDGKDVAKLVVGKEVETSGMQAATQRYVRKAGEKQSYLANVKLDLHDEPTAWLAKEVVKVPKDRVRSIEIRQPDGETVLVDRASATIPDFTLHGVPAGKEATYPTVANSLATGLEFVNLEDVSPAAEVDFATGAGPIARFTTFDGLVVTVTTKDQDGKSFASFAASYEAPAAPVVEPPKEGEAAPAPPPPTKSADEVKAEVETLNARFSKWAYVISSYSRAQFGKKMSELVKDVAPPAPPAGELGSDAQPVVIPSDLPPEIREQIRQHQESLGNKTVDGPPRPKPPEDSSTPPVEHDHDGDGKPDHDVHPEPDSKPPQR